MTRRPGTPAEKKPSQTGESAPSRELSTGAARPIIQGSDPDASLIDAFLRGKTEAFTELVKRYQDRLYNTLYRYLNQEDDALDVVQESFLSAYQGLPRFKRGSQFYTWLYRIAMNHAIDLRRRGAARLAIAAQTEGLENAPDQSLDNRPEALLERKEVGELVQRGLTCLSSEHRLVLVLKDIEDMQYEDIAEVIGVPIGTIRSRLHRARLELREVLLRLAPLEGGVSDKPSES